MARFSFNERISRLWKSRYRSAVLIVLLAIYGIYELARTWMANGSNITDQVLKSGWYGFFAVVPILFLSKPSVGLKKLLQLLILLFAVRYVAIYPAILGRNVPEEAGTGFETVKLLVFLVLMFFETSRYLELSKVSCPMCPPGERTKGWR